MTGFRLDREAREAIMCQLATDKDMAWAQIARAVGCHRSTIEREVTRNGSRNTYSAYAGHQRALQRRRRSTFRFELDPELAAAVRRLLVAGYSPYAVAHITGAVCTETIYQGIYSGRLGLEARHVLRTRRRQRRHRHLRQPTNSGNYLGDFTPIAARPQHIASRDTLGHWEGDLITGSANQSAIITLTERHSRYLVALELPNGHSADATITRIHQWLNTRNRLVHSITWDRGAELTRWTQLRDRHGIAVYFCDPKSPWQRASAENANRQLRFWFPRRTNLSIYTQGDLNKACHILNTTPRRIHNNHTAHHLYHHQPRTQE